jgi:hypothetical protein
VNGDDADDNDMPTDAEASKFTFLERLKHYMERAQISEDNRKAVELAIMLEAGTTIREMDPMKKEVKEKAFLNSYVSIIQEIPDERFEHAAIGLAMLLSYKGARKKVLEGGTLWRKYENELNEVRSKEVRPQFSERWQFVEIAKRNRSASADEASYHHQTLEGEISCGKWC